MLPFLQPLFLTLLLTLSASSLFGQNAFVIDPATTPGSSPAPAKYFALDTNIFKAIAPLYLTGTNFLTTLVASTWTTTTNPATALAALGGAAGGANTNVVATGWTTNSVQATARDSLGAAAKTNAVLFGTNVVFNSGSGQVTATVNTNLVSVPSTVQIQAGSFLGASNTTGDFIGSGRALTSLNADSLFYTNKIIDLGSPRLHDMTLGTFGAGLPDPIGWTTASGYHGATWSINPSDVVGTNITFRTTFGSEIGTNTFTFRYSFSWFTTNGVYVTYPTAGSADVAFTMTNKGFYTLTNSFSVNLGTTNFAAYQVNIAFFNETNIVGFKQVTLQIK